MDAQTAGQMLDTAVAQAKKDGSYKKAYDSAYSKAYAPAYKKAYDSAYSSAYYEAHDKAYSEAYDKAYDEAYDKAYKKAYDKAYKKAYKKAYDKAYKKAYDKAWKKAQDKIEDKYADAEEKYKLNDLDFKATKTTLYENFSEMRKKITTTTEKRWHDPRVRKDGRYQSCLHVKGTFSTKGKRNRH